MRTWKCASCGGAQFHVHYCRLMVGENINELKMCSFLGTLGKHIVMSFHDVSLNVRIEMCFVWWCPIPCALLLTHGRRAHQWALNVPIYGTLGKHICMSFYDVSLNVRIEMCFVWWCPISCAHLSTHGGREHKWAENVLNLGTFSKHIWIRSAPTKECSYARNTFTTC